MEPTIHPIQAKILNVLRFTKDARFSELNIEKLTNDHFTFHVNRLVSLGLIEKTNGTYTLTDKGKEFANRLGDGSISPVKQGKIAALIVCMRRINGELQYLIQQRLRHPYFGFYGFPGGKVIWGETVFEAAEKLLAKQTELQVTLSFLGMHHKIDYLEEDILEDKYYFVFSGEIKGGLLLEECIGGKNSWMTMEQIKKLDKRLSGLDTSLNFLDKKTLTFSESKVREENY